MNKYEQEGNYLANIDVLPDSSIGGAAVTFYRARGRSRTVWMNEDRLNQLHKRLSVLGYNVYPIYRSWSHDIAITYTNRGKSYNVAYGYRDELGHMQKRLDWYFDQLQDAKAKLERAVRLLEGLQGISDINDLDNITSIYAFYREEFDEAENFIKAHRGI